LTITEEPETPSGDASTTPTRRRSRLIPLLVVVVVAAVGIWIVADDGSNDDANLPKADPGAVGTVPGVVQAPPDAEGTALLDLLDKGHDLTFHATYKGVGDVQALGGETTIEVWRKDGKVRQDATVVQDGTTNRSASVTTQDGKVTSCAKRGDLPWTCEDATTSGDAEAGIFATPANQLQGADVRESDETVEGRAARCYSFDRDGGTAKLCLSPEGMPLSNSAAGQQIVITSDSSDVDDSVFALPPAS
jgi:hypothetical protein